MEELDVYSLVGESGLTRLVAAFYRRVPQDDILGPMYPAPSGRRFSPGFWVTPSPGPLRARRRTFLCQDSGMKFNHRF